MSQHFSHSEGPFKREVSIYSRVSGWRCREVHPASQPQGEGGALAGRCGCGMWPGLLGWT